MSIKSDDTPESLQDGKPNSELQFQIYVTHQLTLFTVSIWLSGLSWLGLLSCPEGNNSRKEVEGSHQGKMQDWTKAAGEEAEPWAVGANSFLWRQLDEVDWVELLLSLVGGVWLWTWREERS